MNVTIEIGHVIGLLLAFLGCIAGLAKITLSEFERRLKDRFEAQDAARREGQKVLHEILEQHLSEERRNATAVQNLERDFLRWQADLPLNYVRREDYVRGQVIIEAKLDAVYNKIEVVQLKGALNA